MLYREFLKCQVLDIADGEEWREVCQQQWWLHLGTMRRSVEKEEEKIPLIATAGHRKEKL